MSGRGYHRTHKALASALVHCSLSDPRHTTILQVSLSVLAVLVYKTYTAALYTDIVYCHNIIGAELHREEIFQLTLVW